MISTRINTYIPVQRVAAKNGVTYAYRRLGAEHGVPLVCHIHVSHVYLSAKYLSRRLSVSLLTIFLQSGQSLNGLLGPYTYQTACAQATSNYI
jgi:hypothetical protein